MASKVTEAIYELMHQDRPVTLAGVGYMLRNAFSPALGADEIQRSLDWLLRNRYVTAHEDRGFGMEYLKARRE